MGIAWVTRQQFISASLYKQQLDQWKCGGVGAKPINPELDPLVDLLEGKAEWMIHAYRDYDVRKLF